MTMSKSDYDIVIGLEIHAELNTKSKIFCSCQNKFGQEPNTNCCPVCTGMPGALPVLNKEAVKLTIKAGLSCGCAINDYAVFERKNYFYPDLSKAYQISQLVKPICVGGQITLDSGKVIRLNRIHLEEDAGKLIHGLNETYIDYNRGGVPLIESVTEPDISSADEALEFLTKLRNRFIFSDVAHCKMEQGGMRCDVNLSVKRKGDTTLGTRTEMKNLNSFKSVARAIEYESNRQIELLEKGEKIIQETRKWDDEREKSFSMRSKEDSQDYRYFPDPDLLTVKIDTSIVDQMRKELPLSQEQRIEKYTTEYGLSSQETNILVSSKVVSDYFDSCVKLLNHPKEVANWVLTDIMRLDFDDEIPISCENLTEIIKLLLDKKISRSNAKILFEKHLETKEDILTLAKKMDMLSQITKETIMQLLDEIIEQNPKAVQDYAKDANCVTQFFIGQVMKATKGKADGAFAREYIGSKLGNNK